MKSEEQGEDGEEVDRQFLSRRCKTKSLAHQRDQIFFSALQLKEIKAKEDNFIAMARIQFAPALNIFIFSSTAITNTFSCK